MKRWEWASAPKFDNANKALYDDVLGIYPKLCNGGFGKNGLIPVAIDDKWGYANEQGEIIISPQFEEAKAFETCGLAMVRQDGKWGWVDSAGKLLVKPKYSFAHKFSEGFARVTTEKARSTVNEYIDIKGKTAIRFEISVYEFEDFHCGLAIIASRFDGYGYINTSGEEVIPRQYTKGSDFHEPGRAVVVNKKGYMLIDTTGAKLGKSPFEHLDIYQSSAIWGNPQPYGLMLATTKEGTGVIDMSGNFVIEPRYEYITIGHDGPFIAKEPHSRDALILDYEGNVLCASPDKSLELSSYTNGMMTISLVVDVAERHYGYMDDKGTVVVPPQYIDAGCYNENGIAVVSKESGSGCIDKTGNVVIPLKYDWVGGNSHGMKLVSKGDKRGVLDINGNVVVDLEFDDLGCFSENGVAVAKIDGKFGFIRLLE